MQRIWFITIALMLALAGCAGEDDPTQNYLDVQVDTTADNLQNIDVERLNELGTLRLTANYDGEVPDTAAVVLVLFTCPFSMPPAAFGDFDASTVPATGDIPYIEPGHYCLMAYIDMNPEDGTHPVPGLDPEALPPEGESTIELDIEKGKVTEMTLDFEVIGEEPVDEDPGADDVWIHARIICDNCPAGGKFVFYGMPGDVELDGMPEYYYERMDPVFPFIAIIKESNLLGYKVPFPADTVTISAYHDVDGQGMGPEEGDHVGPTFTLDLVPGSFNKLTFTLK